LFIFLSIEISAQFKGRQASIVLWEELKDSIIGSVAIQNLFTFFTVKNQVEVIPKDTRLVYLMENQNWEKVLVYHWKKYIGNRVFGVAHATVRFWDLRYSFRKNLSGFRMNECKPDKIVYNGPLSKKRLLNFGYKEKDLIPGEALRFLGLDSLSKKSNSSKKNKIFLVFTDYLFSVSKFQLDLLDSIEFPYQNNSKTSSSLSHREDRFSKFKF
jgi:surface carbohydrate biosynthesis protein (TIGR04326 family)